MPLTTSGFPIAAQKAANSSASIRAMASFCDFRPAGRPATLRSPVLFLAKDAELVVAGGSGRDLSRCRCNPRPTVPAGRARPVILNGGIVINYNAG